MIALLSTAAAVSAAGAHAAERKPVHIDSVVVGDGVAPGPAASGVVAVNAAAGTGNQQANLAVFSIGDRAFAAGLVVQHQVAPTPPKLDALVQGAGTLEGDAAGQDAAQAEDGAPVQGAAQPSGAGPAQDGPAHGSATLQDDTSLEASAQAVDHTHLATIADGAFAGASGLIAVNVASGADNQQANVVAIAIGIEGPVMADAMLSQTRSSPEPDGQVDAPEVHEEARTTLGDGAFSGASGVVQMSLLGGERNSSANTFAVSFSGGVGE